MVSTELFHLAKHSLFRLINTILNRHAIEIIRWCYARYVCTKGEQRRVNSHAVTLAGKIEDRSLRKLHWIDDEVASDGNASPIRSRSLVNRHRTRIPWLLFQRHFIAVLLSSYLKFPGASCVRLIPS